MFRRRSRDEGSSGAQPPSPPPRWQHRVDEARSLIYAESNPPWVVDRVHAFERALHEAQADRDRVAAAAERLDPERAARRYKDALRQARSGRGDDPGLEVLRQRYDTVNQLLNKVADLDAAIDRAVADLELLAVRAVGATLDAAATPDSRLGEQLDTLRDDLTALDLARREVRDL